MARIEKFLRPGLSLSVSQPDGKSDVITIESDGVSMEFELSEWAAVERLATTLMSQLDELDRDCYSIPQ